ncbi:MAG: hypothetical protein Q7S40_06955 [Opitutaceae bacterium]|nr:hypothetical protein [Opitutaceae bacterium]
MNRVLIVALVMAWLGGASACKRIDEPARAATGEHVHRAPHGGALFEIGEHAFNLELVRDAVTGSLTAFVLDGHAENFVRSSSPAIELIAIVGAERRPLTLRAVANNATGETVGNTSQFEGQADWLKTTPEFPATIASLEIRGTKFQNIAIYLKKG